MLLYSLLAVACVAPPHSPTTTACDHFEKGAKLIEVHVYEAEGGTREGVAEGMRELRAGLDGGCPREAEALKMMADASWVYASQHSPDRDDARRYQDLARDSYRRYLDLRPNDAHARFRYAVMLRGTSEEEPQLRELVRRNPDFAMGRLSLGYKLIERGDVDAGAAHLAAAARLFNFGQAEDYGDQVVTLLKRHGRKKEAADARRHIDAKLKSGPTRKR